jgi:hypothetical protein
VTVDTLGLSFHDRGGAVGVFSASDVVHPFDETAKRHLESISGLNSAVQAYHRAYTERLQFNANLAETLRLGPRQVPEIYRLLPPICEAFGTSSP